MEPVTRRAEAYNALLEDIPDYYAIGAMGPFVYHLYVTRTAHRDMLQGFLKKGSETGLHYPVPLHQRKLTVLWGIEQEFSS